MLYKKKWISQRSFGIIVSYLSPIIFMIVAVLMQYAIDYNPPHTKTYRKEKIPLDKLLPLDVRLQILNIFVIQAFALNSSVYLHVVV